MKREVIHRFAILAAACLLVLHGWGQQVIGSFPSMDGGFEGQTAGSMTIASSIASGVQRTDWTLQNNTTATVTINGSGGRSGPKYLTLNNGATAARVQSATAASGAITNTTSYTVQFFYKTSGATAVTNFQRNISPDGTGSPGTYGALTMAGTNGTWTLIQQSQTSGSSATATKYGIGILRLNGASATSFDVDDFVIYAGAADVSAPNSPGSVTVSNPTVSTLDVSWGAASGGVDGGGYVVMRYSTSPNADNDPNQNGIYAVGNTTTNGTGSLTGTVVYIGTGTSFTDNTLSAGTTYYYKVYTVDKAFNYSGESSGNGTTAVATSSVSDIISGNNETVNIDYASKTAATFSSTSDGIRVWSFTIRDGGGSSDADAFATILRDVTITKGGSNGVTNWAGTIKQAALYDGSTKMGEVSVTGETIVFTNLNSSAGVSTADGSDKTLDLYLTFETGTVIDNQQFQFTILNSNVVTTGTSSTFTSFTAPVSSVAGDNNRIEVTATDIVWDQQPSAVITGAIMSPSPTLKAWDGNANYDLDYAASVSLTITAGTTTFDGGATTTVSFSSGVATFSNLIFNTTAASNKITATSGLFTDESTAFNVNAPSPEINLKQGVTSYASGGTYGFGSQLSGTSGSAITFTIENTGSATLNISGSPKIVKSGTNASEFTIDETSTSATVASSGTTTFTITFSPTSQGAKTAAITISSDDADEGSYTINLTGTGTVSSASDIIVKTGYTYNTNIAYKDYQATDITNSGTSIEIAQFTIRDGGVGLNDADNLGTTLSQLTLALSNSSNIRRIALYDGSTEVGTEQAGGATVTFTGLSLTTTDGGTKDFSVRVSYNSTVTDNQTVVITVSATTSASSGGSGFGATDAGGAVTSSSGDDNKIEVTADRLAFVVQPSNTMVSSTMSPSVTVSANDVNSNRDLDFTNNVNVTSSGTLDASPKTSAASAGLATFASIVHTTNGTGLTLTAASSGLTDGTSNTFNITIQSAGVLLMEEDFNYSNGVNVQTASGSGWGVISSAATKVTTTSTGLSISNYPSPYGAVTIVGAGSSEDIGKGFTAQTSGSVYYSALVNITSASTGGYFTGFTTNSTANAYEVRLYAKQTASNLNFGISRGNTAATYGATNFSLNTTYLLILKLTMNASTNDDRIDLYVLSANTNVEPTTPEATVSSVADVATIGAMFIRQDASAAAGTIDGIRVGTGWGVVVGNPQYDANTTIASGVYNNITVVSGGTPTLGGDITVNGAASVNGTLNIGTNTLTLSGNASGSGTIASSSGGTVNYNQSSDGQTIIAGTYGNLTFSNFNKTLASSGTIAVAGTFTPGSATGHTITGSTISFNNSTGGQTVPAFNYNNLTIANSSGTNTLSGAIGIAGTFTPGSNASAGTSTVTFNGAAQNIPSFTYNHLTVSNGSNKTAAGALTVNGDFTVSNGTEFRGGSFTHNLKGNWINNLGGTFTAQTCKFVLNGTSAQTMQGSTFYDLEINNNSGVTINTNEDVTNSLTLTLGVFNLNGNTLTLSNGSTIIRSGGSLSAAPVFGSTGTDRVNVTISGTCSSGEELNGTTGGVGTLAVSSGTYTMSAAATVDNLTVTSVLDGADKIITPRASGSVTINGTFRTAVLDGFSGGATTAISNTNTPTITLGASSTIEYNATSGTQTVQGRTDYVNLTLSGNASKTISSGIEISGNFSVSGGTATPPATMTFDGSSTQSISGLAWTNLAFSGASTKQFTSGGSITGTLSVSGNNVTIDADGPSNNIVFTLQSSASATARIADLTNGNTNTGNSITGNITAERYIGNGVTPKRAWRLLSAPVTGVNIFNAWQDGGSNASGYGTQITGSGGGFDAGNASIKTWNGTAWVTNQLTATNSGDVTDYQGYMVFVRGDRTTTTGVNVTPVDTRLRPRGTVRQGTFNSYVTVPNTAGYTLLGNPYASAIDFEAINADYSDLTKFYAWDPQQSGSYGVGAYNMVERTGAATYDVTPQGGSAASNNTARYIPQGVAVLVHNPTGAGSPVTVDMKESYKTSSSPTLNYYRTSSSNMNMAVNLTTAAAQVIDGVRVRYDASYSNNITAEDAQKLYNNNENIAISSQGQFFIVEKRNSISQSDTVQLRLTGMKQQQYQLVFYPADFSGVSQAYVEDSYLNSITAISLVNTTTLGFTVDANAASTGNRFRIVFRTSAPLPVTFNNIRAYQRGSGVMVEWNVSAENNIRHYEVERSSDGRSFSKLGTVNAKGNNNSSAEYNYTDASPLTINYYRIKSVGVNGEEKYSAIVRVNLGKGAEVFTVYPNPVKGDQLSVQLSSLEKGRYMVRMINAGGQVVLQQQLVHGGGSATEQVTIPPGVSRGIYRIELRGANMQVTKTIVLQ